MDGGPGIAWPTGATIARRRPTGIWRSKRWPMSAWCGVNSTRPSCSPSASPGATASRGPRSGPARRHPTIGLGAVARPRRRHRIRPDVTAESAIAAAATELVAAQRRRAIDRRRAQRDWSDLGDRPAAAAGFPSHRGRTRSGRAAAGRDRLAAGCRHRSEPGIGREGADRFAGHALAQRWRRWRLGRRARTAPPTARPKIRSRAPLRLQRRDRELRSAPDALASDACAPH